MKIYISHSSEYDYINKIYNPIKNSNINEKNNCVLPHESKITNTKDAIAKPQLYKCELWLFGKSAYCKANYVAILNLLD